MHPVDLIVHHALIVTGVVPEGLSEAEAVVYEMIAGRMLEAFSPRCEKESLKMECVCEGMDFRSQSAVIVNPGWRAVFSRKEKTIGRLDISMDDSRLVGRRQGVEDPVSHIEYLADRKQFATIGVG